MLGLVVLVAVAWLLSKDHRRFPVRTVVGGLGLQVLFGLVTLKTKLGLAFFGWAQSAVGQLNGFALEGAKMVFGPLADVAAMNRSFPAGGAVFAVLVTGTIIFVSALSTLFYHWGVLQRVVSGMAWVMRRAMGTSGPESLAAAANIFLGQTEAALIIKPYIPTMTRSEVMGLMTAGMATIATGVMVVYANMGIEAGHILVASVLSAPCALLVAKIMLPETEREGVWGQESAPVKNETVNSVDALCRGASEGVMLSLNVIGMLIAFVATVALANAVFGWVQGKVGVVSPVTLQEVVGWLNAPFAWLMGIPWGDCSEVGQALGQRVVLNEFIGYKSLVDVKGEIGERSFILATYALCGFANFSSIAIQIGGIGALAPERRGELAALGLRSMVGGLIACYITACVVGLIL